MAKTKPKKPTLKQVANYMLNFEAKANHAVNTIGQSISDFIDFMGKKEEYIDWLKEKYKDDGKGKTNEPDSQKT
tara:strand:+ start:140 stop:361 length:222 start_codon:yes stop_codon:yes gene_type:complete